MSMLCGRDRELHMVARLLEDARAGRSGALAVVGEAGIGKSALLTHAEERASGMKILRARGVRSEARIPFAGLLELLRPALGCLPAIPGPQAEALQSALALRPARARDRFAIGAATLSLLAAYAETAPVAVLVDDGHWLDGSSADALLFAVRRLVADPVAIIVTVREGESSPIDGAGLATLRLTGLDLPAATDLLTGQLGAPVRPELAAHLHRETGGNPLALIELAGDHELPDDSPPGTPIAVGTSIANAYLLRYRSLPSRARDILVLAAAVDRGDMSVLTKAASLLGQDVAALIPAEAAGLVTVRDAMIEFRHPLARSAIYGQAPPDRRREVHRALASALPDADVDRRAWHLALAAFGPDAAASSALEQAGLRARQRSAYEVSSRAYERGARLAPEESVKTRLLYAAADAAWLGGLADRAAALLEEASQLVTAPDLVLPIEHLRGHIATRRGRVRQAQEILMVAAAQAASTDPDRAVVMLAEAAYAAFFAGDVAGMFLAAQQVAAVVPPDSDGRTAFFALFAQGSAQIVAGEGERGAAQIRQAVEVLERSDELRDDPRLLAWAAMGSPWLREAQVGPALGDRALATARRQAAVGVLPSVLLQVSVGHAASDRWADALAGFHEAIALARETSQNTELACALARLALLEARLGRAEQSRLHADSGLDLSRQLGLGLSEVWSIAALGDLELSLGHPEPALACFEEQQAVLTARGIRDVDLSPVPELVELYLRLGRPQEAAHAAEEYSRAATAKAQPWALARAARCCGLAAPGDVADDSFEIALALHQQTPDVFETARTHLAYGSHLRRARQRVQAREQLRAAIDIFDNLSAEPWSETARSELAATGETARRRDPATVNELTPQELQIALRVAEGRTTRETAAALFLSPKTIEHHLHNVYRKLAISSRRELIGAITRHSEPAGPSEAAKPASPLPEQDDLYMQRPQH
jgi:DNA-binding CsgD family transcriptional regulator